MTTVEWGAIAPGAFISVMALVAFIVTMGIMARYPQGAPTWSVGRTVAILYWVGVALAIVGIALMVVRTV